MRYQNISLVNRYLSEYTEGMKTPNFTLQQFNEKYHDDDACLEAIFKARYVNLEVCPQCEKRTKFYRIQERKCYCCPFCGYQIYPLAHTIFHKSDTPLRLWFYAIFLFSASEDDISAKELQRQLSVTYKCAWRIANKVRALFEDDTPIKSEVGRLAQ